MRVAAARLLAGPGRGERVLVRAPAHARWPAGAGPGAELAIRGRLAELGPFDAYERRRNAHALLRALSIAATGRRRGGVAGMLDGVRTRTERALTSGVPQPQGGLARGMVLGQDGALSEDLREDFRVTGLAHLVAASGSNVLLLATLVLALAAAAGLGLTSRLWLAVALVAAYVPLAGAGPSIQRAGVMGVAGLVAALAGRPSSRWYALLLAAALTLAWSPRAAEDPGWQLSFAAVLAMLALVPALRRALLHRRVPRALGEALAVTVAATLGTAPLIALHFEPPVARLAAGERARRAGRRTADVAGDDRGRARAGRAASWRNRSRSSPRCRWPTSRGSPIARPRCRSPSSSWQRPGRGAWRRCTRARERRRSFG